LGENEGQQDEDDVDDEEDEDEMGDEEDPAHGTGIEHNCNGNGKGAQQDENLKRMVLGLVIVVFAIICSAIFSYCLREGNQKRLDELKKKNDWKAPFGKCTCLRP
jgi:hypothetical protein